jgi:hypothetical protein
VLFRACYPHVIRAARRKMTRPLRALYDPADFVGEVFRNLVAEWGQLDFPSLAALIAHLEAQAERLVLATHRRLRARGEA